MTPQLANSLNRVHYLCHAYLYGDTAAMQRMIEYQQREVASAPGAGTCQASVAASIGWTTPMAGTGEGEA